MSFLSHFEWMDGGSGGGGEGHVRISIAPTAAGELMEPDAVCYVFMLPVLPAIFLLYSVAPNQCC